MRYCVDEARAWLARARIHRLQYTTLIGMSFKYTRKVIDTEVARLGTPLKLDVEALAGPEMSAAKLRQVVHRVNVMMRQHNRVAFHPQIAEQVTQQIVKNEQKRLAIVNDTLMRINTMVIPVAVPDRNQNGITLRELHRLIHELPHPKYLVHVRDDTADDEADGGGSDSDALVQDHLQAEQVAPAVAAAKYTTRAQRAARRQWRQQAWKRLRAQPDVESALEQYAALRTSLLALDAQMTYKRDKLAYLQRLQRQVNLALGRPRPSLHPQTIDSDEEDLQTDQTEADFTEVQRNLISAASTDTGVYSELTRFRILVEKLNYTIG